MRVYTLVTGELSTNTYIVIENKDALIIDANGDEKDYLKIKEILEKNGAFLKGVLFTHGHFDHISLGYKFKGEIPIYIHEKDKDMIEGVDNLGNYFRKSIQPFSADVVLKGGEELNIGEFNIKVIHTPGHTPGSVCYIIGEVLFSGDTLFYMSIGRTDFSGGDDNDMSNSLNILKSLDRDYTVLSGHGESTTLNYEKEHNPYL